MSFDYERETRAYYQNDATAMRYHALFVAPSGWRNLPSRLVARREQRVIMELVAQVPHRVILDAPAGTGKLACVFAGLGARVVAADISQSMLKLAAAEYARIGHDDVTFSVEDVADLRRFPARNFDLAVCLRLMHRVPSALRRRMLAELARVAPHAIVSFGITSGFHSARRAVRAAVFGGRRDTMCFCTLAEARAELEPRFEIIRRAWIAPALSQEVLFLLRAKPVDARPASC
ncbi:MAG TPA: class I SAM-dependent methyltransferase [Rhodanobacteraceae bacterium]